MDCNNFKIQGVKANSTRCVLWAQVCNKQPTSQSDRCKLSPELNKRNNISLFTKPLNFIMYCQERKNGNLHRSL